MIPTTLESRLANARYIMGPLPGAHSLAVPGTELHACEAMALRESNPTLKYVDVWTADFSLYRVKNGEALFSLFPGRYNLILRNIDNSVAQLRSSANYFPEKDELAEILTAAEAEKVIEVPIVDLQLKKHNANNKYGSFDVNPNNLGLLNNAQRAVVESAYKDREPGRKFFILTSESVKLHLKDKENSATARAAFLFRARQGSCFSAAGWYIDTATIGLLAVPKGR